MDLLDWANYLEWTSMLRMKRMDKKVCECDQKYASDDKMDEDNDKKYEADDKSMKTL